jgi:predicted dehydrogenase
LAIHDLSILDYIIPHRAQAVSATGAAHVQGQIENVAYLTVYLEGGALAHVNVNWLSPVKIRRTLIGGSKKMVVYDDLEPSEKIRIYDKGVTLTKDPTQIYEMLVGYRSGDMWAPQIDTHEALHAEARHFVDCIANGKRPASDGEAGLRVVEIAEAATRSMRQRGQPVPVGEARG